MEQLEYAYVVLLVAMLALAMLVGLLSFCILIIAPDNAFALARIGLIKNAMSAMRDSWQITLVISVPLVYSPIRSFLGRVKKLYGVEADSVLGHAEKFRINPGASPKEPTDGA